ncbi:MULTISPECIES: GNAT family N-acetyltransferase [unclassified Clostridioides]|uniref:GNAT family N-acetyltransferase n=2 Tax=unclassified Clostridioides TaxID=2635829 RepID=UPI001D10489D|nr:GNAT family N-acetyltransferase [Clostridioides sp. ES-S-0001-02]MCC0650656.1 GNAT family N-acetyltransferase [Clostridioides sp. ZZV15-6598]MCC0651701.1 GNAT family N-acetyltransferase [Clostridioides sp. ES-S-0001-03]MCC0678785.1 GNAT family N-acetyltransferase [Clostridioides sp. ES-S-0005-03]MCC0703263.1 GNAT family N-acetyltransferase [Clostridioides sp. ES-S-0049-02]MCC0763079.1 GNAT family N-acetyltransferase [Clostridioides sp. ES-S-0006-03]UDN48603.1 GNAT family N-acetyltransferas
MINKMTQNVILKFVEANDLENLENVKILFTEYSNSLNIDLCFQDFNNELKTLPGKYKKPSGSLILAFVDENLAGCVALKKLEDDVCELKRLYVRDKFRGLKIGKILLEEIVKEAKKIGYTYMRLDTLPSMKSAQGLYEKIGFYDINPYTYNPIEGARYMELKL